MESAVWIQVDRLRYFTYEVEWPGKAKFLKRRVVALQDVTCCKIRKYWASVADTWRRYKA